MREEILRSGGSISHHHGVGKLRKRFFKQTVSPAAIEYLKAVKKDMDPKGIFGARNTIFMDEQEEKDELNGGRHGMTASTFVKKYNNSIK